jgi:glutamate synthase domain-containing protein 3
MTGGRAFLLDAPATRSRLNEQSVEAGLPDEAELRTLRELIAAHSGEGSPVAADLLRDWRPERFVVVRPRVAAAEVSVEPVAAAR